MDLRAYPGGRVTANLPVRFLITNAYATPLYAVIGGPAWINSDRYLVEATPEADLGPGRRLQVLQGVLEERFQLKFHHETRELPAYVLSPAKSGLKLPAVTDRDCTPVNRNDPLPPPPPDANRFIVPCGRVVVNRSRSGLRLLGSKVPMEEFATVLSNIMGRAVIDKTESTGTFDPRLDFVPDQSEAGLPPEPPPPAAPGIPLPPIDPSGPSIFRALQDQLGLRLESAKGPVDVLVIDHVERPSEN